MSGSNTSRKQNLDLVTSMVNHGFRLLDYGGKKVKKIIVTSTHEGNGLPPLELILPQNRGWKSLLQSRITL